MTPVNCEFHKSLREKPLHSTVLSGCFHLMLSSAHAEFNINFLCCLYDGSHFNLCPSIMADTNIWGTLSEKCFQDWTPKIARSDSSVFNLSVQCLIFSTSHVLFLLFWPSLSGPDGQRMFHLTFQISTMAGSPRPPPTDHRRHLNILQLRYPGATVSATSWADLLTRRWNQTDWVSSNSLFL